jgi:hypothetical protein
MMGSQRLTASAMARPWMMLEIANIQQGVVHQCGDGL